MALCYCRPATNLRAGIDALDKRSLHEKPRCRCLLSASVLGALHLDEVAEPCPADRRQVDIPWFGWVKLLEHAEHNHHAGKRGEHGKLGREARFRPFVR